MPRPYYWCRLLGTSGPLDLYRGPWVYRGGHCLVRSPGGGGRCVGGSEAPKKFVYLKSASNFQPLYRFHLSSGKFF